MRLRQSKHESTLLVTFCFSRTLNGLEKAFYGVRRIALLRAVYAATRPSQRHCSRERRYVRLMRPSVAEAG